MAGEWTVTITAPDGAERRVVISDLAVQSVYARPASPMPKAKADAITALRMAECNVWAADA